MKKGRLWLALATLALGIVAITRCSQPEIQETEIFLTVSGNVEGIEKVSLIARNRSSYDTGEGGRCESVECSDEIIVSIDDDRDIGPSGEPLTLLLKPAAPIADENDPEGFLIYARGMTEQNVVLASKGKVLKFVPGQQVEAFIEMDAETAACDIDQDGFTDCRCGLPLDDGQFCDCIDSNVTVNPYRTEDCNDNIDNNCTGFPPNEGCPCTEPADCTTLPEEQLDRAGIGQCTFGELDCVGGVLSDTCEGAGSPSDTEIDGDFIDNDCDGDVDEQGVCNAGDARPCLLGQVDQQLGCARGEDDPDNCAASILALGVCQTGTQSCDGGYWGDCVGEVIPNRPVGAVAWGEGVDENDLQCDGLDNDCDGAWDEEAIHDADGDGFTFCGTCRTEFCVSGLSLSCCTAPPGPNDRWWVEEAIDCNDADNAINPDAIEDCREGTDASGASVPIDEDCRCDHDDTTTGGEDEIGLPSLLIDNSVDPPVIVTRCTINHSNLFCDDDVEHYSGGDPHRTDQTPIALCSGTDDDKDGVPTDPYFFGFFPDASTGDCYYCTDRYGDVCDQNTGACEEKHVACVDCASRDTVISPTGTRAGCCYPVAGSCEDDNAPQFDCPAFAAPPAADNDPANLCDGSVCSSTLLADGSPGPIYDGLENTGNDDDRCYYKEGVDGRCDSGACYGSVLECTAAGQGAEDTHPSDGSRDCLRPDPTTCGEGTSTAPIFDVPPIRYADPYDHCPGAASCNGKAFPDNACHSQLGEACVDATDCEEQSPGAGTSWSCVDGVCCTTPSCPTCQACNVNGAGTCAPVTADEGNNCNDDCTECVAGSCDARSVGDFTECSASCDACLISGDCGAYTGDAGFACDDNNTYCCDGNCENPTGTPSEFGAPCGNGDCSGGTWQCNGGTAECSNFGVGCDYCSGDTWYNATCTVNEGIDCNTGSATQCDVCDSCRDDGATTSCVPMLGQNTYGPYTQDSDGSPANRCSGVNRCDGQGNCDLDDGESCGGPGVCVSEFCTDGVCCTTNTCGTCERCDLNGNGTCSNYTANEGRNCNDDCTACVAGSCNARSDGDFTECGGTCQACSGGNCGAATQDDGSSCTGNSTFCCSGTCVNPPGATSDLGDSCGSGDCSGGSWQCNATSYRCSTQSTSCESCSSDNEVAGTCNQNGGCTSGASTECTRCLTCQDNGDTTSCVPKGYGPDNTGSNICTGIEACSAAGSCLAANGQPCAGGCATGNCVDSTCCASSSCGICESCGSGSCQNISGSNGNLCNDDCTYCSSGSCLNRAAGADNECSGTCQACTTAGGNCGNWTAQSGLGCVDDCSTCVAGGCVSRAAGDDSECSGTCQACTTFGGNCGNWTATDGLNCGSNCNQCVAGSCNDRPAGDDTECSGTCQACTTAGGSCGGWTGTSGAGCTDDCDHCVSGSCNSRAAGDDTECSGNCQACTTLGGNCGNWTGDSGSGCTDDCSSCIFGACQSRAAGDGTECSGNCQACTTLGGNCGNWTGDDGPGCIDDCSQCVSGSCNSRAAGDFTECSGDCQACTTLGGNCGNWTGNSGRNCSDDCTSCSGGSCNDRGAGDATECSGTCQACTSSGGNCGNYAADDGANCNDDCTFCTAAGACATRAAGAFDECAGTCVACDAAGGDCNAWTGTDGQGCLGSNETFCCQGQCRNPSASPSEYGGTCGPAGICQGNWECSGTTAQCDTVGDQCDSCSGDQIMDATCNSSGNCGVAAGGAVCAACRSCGVSSGVGSCTNFSGDDTTGANQCVLCETCSSGSCVDDNNNGTEPGCTGGGNFCCQGNCHNTSEACSGAAAGCAGNYTGCTGGTFDCDSATNACGGTCPTADEIRNGTCSTDGTACNLTATQPCAACWTCDDAGATASCIEKFATSCTDEDTTAPGICNGNESCRADGGCENDSGVGGCGGGGDCCSDGCTANVCD